MSRSVAPDAPRLYSNGQPWRNARGRDAPRQAVETEFKAEHAVVDLSTQPPIPLVIKCLVRELRIRFYAVNTVKNYRSAWVCFFRWYRGPLDQIDQEDIPFIQKLLGHTNLETTSLYTKVAQMKATAVASPLDQLGNESGPSVESPVRQSAPRPSVGQMRLEVDPNPDSSGAHAVTLGVWQDGELLPLPGVLATMPRPDWVSLQIPLQDTWEPTLCCLPAAQRERLESPEFFSLVQQEVAKRMLRIRDTAHSQTIKT